MTEEQKRIMAEERAKAVLGTDKNKKKEASSSEISKTLKEELAKSKGKTIAASPKKSTKVSHNPIKGTLASIGVGAREGVKSAVSNAGTWQSVGKLNREIDSLEETRKRAQKAGIYNAQIAKDIDNQISLRKAQMPQLIQGQKEKNAASNARLQAVDDRYELGKVGEFAQDLGGAFGQMLPSLGVGVVNPAAGLATFGVQAATQGYGQALDSGATHEQAARYGVGTGLLEAGIERATGGLSRFYGRGVLDKAMRMAPNNSVKNVILNTAKGAAGEGAEEAVSAIADPYLQRATYDPAAENASFSDAAYQAAIGAALGGMLGGGSNALSYRAQKRAAERAQTDVQGAQGERTTIDTSAQDVGLNGDVESLKVADESSHIDKRDYRSVGSRKMNAFSYDNPEIRPYYVTEAKRMQRELSEAQKPEMYFGVSENGLKDTDAFVGGHGRIASADIVTARDEIGLSYKEIDKALDDIIADNGRENNANAKKLEVLFDQNLSMGTEGDGYHIPPNAGYIRTKEGIAGAKDYGYKAEQTRYESGEYDPISEDPYAFESTVYAIAQRRGHELTEAEAEEVEALQEVIDADRTAFTEEEIRQMIDEQVDKWKAPRKVAQSPYEQAYDDMLRGEDRAKPKAETEDERKVKDFIQSAAVRARMQVKYVDRPLVQKAYYKDGVIYINKNRPLDEGVKVTVAHELYHAMEGTKEHEAIIEMAIKAQGNNAQKLIVDKINDYASHGIELDETGARAEIGAEFIEKALTDEATINQVLLEDRTLAAKILERIKEIIAVYKAKKSMKAEEAREYAALLKARRLYEDGLEKLHKGENKPAGTERARYQAIKRTDDGRNYVEIEEDILQGVPKSQWGKVAMQNLAKKFPNGVQIGNNLIKINAVSRNELQNSRYSKNIRNRAEDIYRDKMAATNNADELLQSNRDYVNEEIKHERKDNIQQFGRGEILFKVGQNTYAADMVVGNKADGSMVMYDIVNIRPENFNEKRSSASESYSLSDRDVTASTDNIPNSVENVNSKSVENENFSERYALDGEQTGTPEFKQWFGGSKVVDENGKPKVMYHQTANDFTMFNAKGDGAGRTDSETPHGIFIKPTNQDIGIAGEKQMALYANIKNPLVAKNRDELSNWYKRNINGYKDIDARIKANDEYYQKIYDEAEAEGDTWYDEHYDDLVAGKISDEEAEKFINGKTDKILAEWKEKDDALRIEAKDLLDRYFAKSNYDGVHLLYDGSRKGVDVETWIAFDSTQIKSATDNVGTFDSSNPDIRYALGDNGGINGERYNELLDRYGRIDEGMEPREDVAVPKQVNDWDKTRRFVRTAMESENVSAEAKDKIADSLASDIASGKFVYEPIRNQKLQEKANANIAKVGYEKSKAEIFAKYQKNERIKAEDVATLEQLIVKASAEGKAEEVMDMVGLASMIGTEIGQSIQALSMLKRMSPEGRLRQMTLLRDRLNSKYELTGDSGVEIDPRYAEMMLDKNNSSENMDTIQSYIIDDMAKQLPVDMKDKFDAWRYLAMLGNPRTHIRNIVGNILNLSLSRINDQLAGVVEAAAVKKGLVKEGERTKSAGMVSKELRDFAKADWETNGKKRTDLSNKYGERGQAERNRKIFTSKLMQPVEHGRKWNENTMDAEDTAFKKVQYIYALSHYMKANNITPEIMQIENSPIAERARQYAEDEAYRVTFQEANALASALNHFEHKNTDSKLEKGGQLAVKALMPFKKTPLNILKRGVEYSPAGLINGINNAIKLVRKGDIPATQVINEITQGLTGTGIVALGYFLAEAGLLSAGYDEGNKREQNYENQIGGQNYAITLPGGGTYTLDWAAPTVMPLFVGAALNDEISSREEGENIGLRDIGSALIKVTDPVLEMSCMDSLQSALESYGNEGAISNMITSAATSYVMQFVPTLSGQFARTIDETKRSTYAPSDSKYTKTGESLGRQFMNKVPGLSYKSEAAVDVWGRERKQAGGNIAGRAFNNMLSPGTYSSNKETATDKELKRLYEASGESGVLPKMGSKYISYKTDGEKSKTYYLTSKEYTKYQMKYGQDNFKAVSELVRSNVYRLMSDEDKAAAVKEIYTYNAQMANKEFFKGRNVSYDAGASTTEKLKDAGGWANYFAIKQAFPDSNYDVAKKRKDKCDKYGIDYTAYAESNAKIAELRSANSERYTKASDKTEANKRAIAQYLASRKDLTNPQRQVIWQEYYSGKTSETYISVARRATGGMQ